MNNTELVKHCANDKKNKKAWLEFLSRYENLVYNTIIQECKNSDLHKNCFQFDETVKDLVQEVYLKLLQNECKALKKFRGESENSIYSYLKIIARNEVRNYINKMQAKKRPPIDRLLDDSTRVTGEKGEIYNSSKYKTILFDPEQEFKLKILKEEIDYCLKKILTGRDKKRNRFIYQLHIYNGFSPKEIASYFNFGISTSRIANIISDSRQKLIKSWSLVEDYGNITC